jgi:general secretion pathway protein G
MEGGGSKSSSSRGRGFTLIELLVVLAVMALLLSLAAPRYFQHVDRAREAVLQENLATLRDAIDQFRADTGQWPANLDNLVEKRYLRAVPKDPVTDSVTTWIVVSPPDGGDGVYDVHSGAEGVGADGRPYGDW